jgi:predicted nicotinamide N-methyase
LEVWKIRATKVDATDCTTFVNQHTSLRAVPLVPKISLHVADELVPIWQWTERELSEGGLPPPYWAFAWAGGQALARYILDHPETVTGKTVLDFASGSGLVAIAAVMAGAQAVTAADIDVFAAAACELNARANNVTFIVTSKDFMDEMNAWDVVLEGDICYEKPLATRVTTWLGRLAARGATVLIGDPGRNYLPKENLQKLIAYAVKTSRKLEDTDMRNTGVWYFCT